MTETTELTREQIAQWLAQAEADDWGPEMSTDDQCDVLRLALRTLDAEAQIAEMTAQSESYKTMALSAARRVRDIHAIVCGEDDSLSPREQHEAIVDVLRGHHALGPWTAAEADLARKIASDPCVVSKRWPGGGVEHARIVGEEAERAERSHRTLCGDSAQFLLKKVIPWIAAMTERSELAEAQLAERDRYIAEQRAITEPSVQDLARQLREANERAEKAERDLAEAGKLEERIIDALGRVATMAQTRIADAERRIAHAQRERDAMHALHVDTEAGLRMRIAEVDLERDEEGRRCAEQGALYTDMARQRDDWHGVAHAAAERSAVSSKLREAAEAERDAIRTKLADAERRLGEMEQERDAGRDLAVARLVESDALRTRLAEAVGRAEKAEELAKDRLQGARDASRDAALLAHRMQLLEEVDLRTAKRERDDAIAKLAQVQKEAENLLWNLAGCDTIASSGTPTTFDDSMARPALHAVNQMATRLVDGIFCRDATIAGLKSEIEELVEERDQLRAELAKIRERRFPIQGGPSIPWRIIAPHENQAMKNHSGQSLERIAERGGLSPSEAVAVLHDRPWCRMDTHVAIAELNEVLRRYEDG